MKNLIEVGKIGRKVGLKGFCKIYLASDFPQFFTKDRILVAKLGEREFELKIEEFRENRGEIKFVGCNSPEEASALTHTMLYTTVVETKNSIELNDDELFWFDLIGVRVYENDRFIGTISEIYDGVELFVTIKIDESFETKQRDLIIPWNEHFVVDASKERVDLAHVLEIVDAL